MTDTRPLSVDPRRDAVLDAALGVFSAYGYRRTTMADLAHAAGVSRPALYLFYANKEALFRALASRLLSRQLAAAIAALDDVGPPGRVLERAILARDLEVFRLFAASPHGNEIAAEGNARIADLHSDAEAGFASVLSRWLKSKGATKAAATARMIGAAAHGIKQMAADEADYLALIRQLAAVVTASLQDQG